MIAAPPLSKGLTQDEFAVRGLFRKSSMGEYLGAKVKLSFDETILSTLAQEVSISDKELRTYSQEELGPDPLRLAYAEARGQEYGEAYATDIYIKEEDWPESEHYREGIKWSPNLTDVRAQAYAEAYDWRQIQKNIIERKEPGLGTALLGFGASIVGQLPDPFNYIGLPSMGAVKGVGRKAMLAAFEGAVGNLGVDAVVFPYLNRQGEDYRAADYLLDMTLGALIGGAAGWSGAKLHARKVERLKTMADAKTRFEAGAAMDLAATQHALGEDIDVSPVLNTNWRNKSAQQVDSELERLALKQEGWEADWSTARPDQLPDDLESAARALNDTGVDEGLEDLDAASDPVLAAADERIAEMEKTGMLTEAESKLISESRQGVEKAGQWEDAFVTAVDCLIEVAV